MATSDIKPLLEALSCPLGELIASVGRGVAEAQRELDHASLATLQDVYARGDGLFGELQKIGYRPTWYHIPEAEGDLQVALTISGNEASAGAGTTPPAGAARSKLKLYAAPVDAGYASRFGYTLNASSRVKFKIVPVPPSNAAEALLAMPALTGLSLSEARARLALLGITASLPSAADSAIVTSQQPAPGTLLGSNTAVTVAVGG
jgi:hypothetical protein